MGGYGGVGRRPFLRARLRLDSRFRVEVEQARAHSVPHSILLGRPLPGPGEPLFLAEDTAAAVALGEEERDSCQACGMPKVWCRDPAHQFAFEVREDRCWATYAVAQRNEKHDKEGMHAATRQAVQISPRFREGHLPRVDAGLDFD